MSSLSLDVSFACPRFGSGHVRLRLVNAGDQTLRDFRLAFSSFVLITPPDDGACRLERRIGTLHEIAPRGPVVIPPGGVWETGPLHCEYQLVHANDGPVRAWLIFGDDSTAPVHLVPAERLPVLKVGDEAPPALCLDAASDTIAAAWATAAGCEARLYPDDGKVFADGASDRVVAQIDEARGPEEFTIDDSAGGAGYRITGGSRVAVQWALMELARRRRGDGGLAGTTFAPRHGFRSLEIDMSRHFYPADDVAELIDLAAWRKLNVVHLHLTDDQGWRMPSSIYPALADVGAWRGHGLPIPPLNGSEADVYGGCYTVEDIRRWVAMADALGVELIPELDVPGHCFAPAAALPQLRDPADTGTVESAHHFPANVLNPGLPATWEFLENVFGEVADLFPGRWINIGCDEVATGAWDGSPAAVRYAQERGLNTHRDMEIAFVAEIIALVKRTTGRQIGAAEEAATVGGLRPGDGYVLGWTSNAVCHELAKAGHQVVSMPAEQYYLDMAPGMEWHLPGMWYAGVITNETIAAFDPLGGLDNALAANIVGIQAALWGEHVKDRATIRTLVLQRLDAFGDVGWEHQG